MKVKGSIKINNCYVFIRFRAKAWVVFLLLSKRGSVLKQNLCETRFCKMIKTTPFTASVKRLLPHLRAEKWGIYLSSKITSMVTAYDSSVTRGGIYAGGWRVKNILARKTRRLILQLTIDFARSFLTSHKQSRNLCIDFLCFIHLSVWYKVAS